MPTALLKNARKTDTPLAAIAEKFSVGWGPRLAAFALLAALAFGPVAQAQGVKIGVIDMQGALLGTKDGQKAAEELKGKFAPKEAEFNKRSQDLASKQDQYRKSAATMNDESKAAAERDIQLLTKNLQRDADDAKADAQAEEQRLLGGIMQKMQAVLDKYATDNQLTMIVDISTQPNNLIYADEASNITKAVMALYDKSAAVTPAPAAAKPPAARPPAATAAPAAPRRPSPAPAPK
jgi:outer membrane protein